MSSPLVHYCDHLLLGQMLLALFYLNVNLQPKPFCYSITYFLFQRCKKIDCKSTPLADPAGGMGSDLLTLLLLLAGVAPPPCFCAHGLELQLQLQARC